MSNTGVLQEGVLQAKGILREMTDGSMEPMVDLRQRVEDLMATLDVVLGALPAETPDEVLEFVEQIVTNLYNADMALRQSGEASAMRSLALAEKRIVRLRDVLAALG
ncbi:MAG: hypothetical protein H6838_15635 [Planctomycetes bacterium]|nr:hypothetical protein [Planctomycetota bacterium]MCB9886923.1 hypothetical protein [Planctomycetota bacterium]